MRQALVDHAIPNIFPEAVLAESDQLPDVPDDPCMSERVDLRDRQFITIDGASARDYDDAVYCEERDRGGWTLWVAIADVSSYVDVSSQLDSEAKLRGTSVYFPECVIPMLPQRLSDGLCSLMPGEDRLCLACELSVDANGTVSNYRFYEALMRSHRRFTYDEVADLLGLEGRKADDALLSSCAPWTGMLSALYRLYKVLASCRKSRGAIDFDAPDYQFNFDAKDMVVGVYQTQHHDAHRLIEECMLAANVVAAQFLQEHKMSAPYRVHPPPTGDNMQQLRGFLGTLGINMNANIEARHMQKVLKEIKGRAEEPLVNMTVLRAMSKAVYTTENQGHFGLCYQAYTHFTSPIRRYPDLLVHRAIRSVIRKQDSTHLFPYGHKQVSQFCEQNSQAERRAEEACRKVNQQLACSFLLNRLGEKFDGVITGVVPFGLFVHLHSYGVDGLAHITDMEGYFHHQPKRQSLASNDGSQVYRLGDSIQVLLTQVRPNEAKLSLQILTRVS